jgi:anthraniloyl-CoA monooxygenase
MRILCIGGGPAGLYFALLMKLQNPANVIRVAERNRPFDTFGWGVVFSDQTLGNLQVADPVTAAQIGDAFNHWDDIDVHFRGRTVRSGGHGFCGIGRKRLLNILQQRCLDLGVELTFEQDVTDDQTLGTEFAADLVIASDGLNSRIRTRYAETYQPDIDLRECRFVWLGTKKTFDAFTFTFEQTEHGWFQAHAYKYDDTTSTFIVETPEAVWKAHGLDAMEQPEAIAFCEKLFAKYLDGHALMSNATHLRGSANWIRFPRVICKSWVKWNGAMPVVLMGDAAHTAHFSIGSGTKLALEDAIELTRSFAKHGEHDLRATLANYEAVRSVEVLKIQNAARNSTEWFENVDRYTAMEVEQFAYSLLTRSQRISHENLRVRDAAWLGGYERWLASVLPASSTWIATVPFGPLSPGERVGVRDVALDTNVEGTHRPSPLTPRPSPGQALRPRGEGNNPHGVGAQTVPPMLLPLTARSITLANRVVVSPMAMYSAVNGVPGDFHLVHLGARALGGAGLVFAEMTCPSPEGRITTGCTGLWNDEQMHAWRRIVGFVHASTTAKIGVQIGHSGPKGSTQLGWETTDEPMVQGNWPLIAASAIAFGPQNQIPKAMTADDMREVTAQFVASTERAAKAGFDWLELHCAHGYLLSSFICPLTNVRTDECGGSIEARCRYPLEVFRAMRAVWPEHLPMSVRISAHDWADGGNTADDAIVVARLFKDAGADFIDVSSGQTTRDAKPVYGRMYQTPFADRIRNEVGIRTIAVGAISEADHVNSIIAAGRADLCAIARPHLADAAWTLHEAAKLGSTAIVWPKQYLSGRDQLYRGLAKDRAVAAAMAGLSAAEVAAKQLEQ